MLNKILKEYFRWNEEKIQAFYRLLEVVGISKQLDESFKRAAAERKLQTRAEWVIVLNGILQKCLFPRISDMTNSVSHARELDAGNVLIPHIEVLSGKKVIIPAERLDFPDFRLQNFQREISIFEEALNGIDGNKGEINLAVIGNNVAERSKLQSFVCNLRKLPFGTFFNPTTKENKILILLRKYQTVNFDLIMENAEICRQAIKFLVAIRMTISLEELKALKVRLQQKKDSLQFLLNVKKALEEFGVFEPEPLETDKNAIYLVGPQGDFASRVIKRIAHAVNVVKQLVSAGVEVKYFPLFSRERPIKPKYDFEGVSEINLMQLIAENSVGGLGVTIIPINTPMIPKRNGEAINEVLQDPNLGYKEKRAGITALLQKSLNSEDVECPDRTFVAVYTAFILCDMIESGLLPNNKKIKIVCIAEAPYLGKQTQQAIAGLELVAPSQIAQNIEFQLTGSGVGNITGTKALFDALDSVAGEIYWGGQRPSLKRALVLKDKTESKVSHLASALSNVVGALTLSGNSLAFSDLESSENSNVLSFSIRPTPFSLTGTTSATSNNLSAPTDVGNAVEKKKEKEKLSVTK